MPKSHPRKPQTSKLGYQSLEIRQLLAGVVNVDLVANDLFIRGDDASNQISISLDASRGAVIESNPGTQVEFSNKIKSPISINSLDNIFIRMGAGDDLLAFDMQIKCWEEAHMLAAVIATVVLLVVGVLIPAILLTKVRRSRLVRDASLQLKADEVELWFEQLDSDRSGTLEGPEIKELLRRMGQTTNTKTMKRVMTEISPDGSNSASKAQFEAWVPASTGDNGDDAV